MKNVLALALLAGALAFEALPALAQTTQEPMSKATKKAQRKARRQNGPEVYKGTVAEQRRIVTDAPGAEKDDNADDTSTKKSKRNKQ
ncbi:hypothetical protein HHL22_14435 [Hymenobacter sp. RP-2-7]|uniref:Uncharacterized protein n=1 Tax=Hymenobacter polaris TaxID=2682546 RepID=A0A7Y0FNB7_9BACT|nr:hypothetical protein [Hymenobacter polaris]NML66406.1 hypothetical protein [Hymenobacter polaris]